MEINIVKITWDQLLVYVGLCARALMNSEGLGRSETVLRLQARGSKIKISDPAARFETP